MNNDIDHAKEAIEADNRALTASLLGSQKPGDRLLGHFMAEVYAPFGTLLRARAIGIEDEEVCSAVTEGLSMCMELLIIGTIVNSNKTTQQATNELLTDLIVKVLERAHRIDFTSDNIAITCETPSKGNRT